MKFRISRANKWGSKYGVNSREKVKGLEASCGGSRRQQHIKAIVHHDAPPNQRLTSQGSSNNERAAALIRTDGSWKPHRPWTRSGSEKRDTGNTGKLQHFAQPPQV
ncbi:hypothetical protein E4U57_001499 [Claviceps arundinis]|uniref:Uncharacterized protein n=1 Tax=Claviceps arundinis TaxID=1623583 RepID=A0A9P7N1X6_9HYPO|nr:hypothetical protein E4U57_001499 [Claviceps arundinis]KAG5977940.1 hypothetical protein E4U56_006288 [Claviceps arundinis]